MEDQSGIIEQLRIENEQLRACLHNAPSRELQIAQAMSVLMRELVELGPHTTARVLTWAVRRHMKSALPFYEQDFWDRRPKVKEDAPPPPPELERRMKLRRARVAAGMSQSELARLADLPQPYVSQIELGKKDPTEETWQRLEQAIQSTASLPSTPEQG